jgi:GYF domain 2
MSSDTAQSPGTYFVRVRGKIHGPFDIEKLKKLHSRGQFSRAHEVSQDKRSWQPAGTLRELFATPDPPLHQPGDNVFLPADVEGEDTALHAGGPPDSTKWWYNAGDERHGPVSLMDLRQMVLNRQVTPHDPVWKEGFEDWVPIANQPEFQMQLSGGARFQSGVPGMDSMPGGPAAHLRRTSGLAVASVTLGVVGLFPAVCSLLIMVPHTSEMLLASVFLGFVALFLGVSNVFAIIFGAASMMTIGRSGGYLTGWGMALSGLIMGAVGWLFWLLFWLRVLSLPHP